MKSYNIFQYTLYYISFIFGMSFIKLNINKVTLLKTVTYKSYLQKQLINLNNFILKVLDNIFFIDINNINYNK